MRSLAHHPIGTSEFALPAGTAVCVGKSPTTRFDGFLPFLRKGVGKFPTRPSVFAVLGTAIVGELPTRLSMCVGKFPTADFRSEEHTSELQSLMRNSYAVFCLKKKYKNTTIHPHRK